MLRSVEPLGDLRAGEVGEVTARSMSRGARYPAAPMGQNEPTVTATATTTTPWSIGAGHNGLVCAAYLAKAGLRTLLVEARVVGRRHGVERVVRRRHGQHLQLRPHHVPHHAGDRGARPRRSRSALHRHRSRAAQHGVGRRPAVDDLSTTSSRRSTRWPARIPAEVDGYRRYLKAALPAVRMVLDNANDPPTLTSIGQQGARPPRSRRGDAAALEPAQRRRRDAQLLHRPRHCAGRRWSPGRWCGACRRSWPAPVSAR